MPKAIKCELFYGSGGHGGPYPSKTVAVCRARELLAGSPTEKHIYVRPSSDWETMIAMVCKTDRGAKVVHMNAGAN